MVHNLANVSENYNCDLPKVSNLTIVDNFYLPKVMKMFKITCPELVKVTGNLLDFDIDPDT